MKRSRPFPKASGPSVPTLFVCLLEPATPFHSLSLAFYRGPSGLRSPLPPRFAPVPHAFLVQSPPTHNENTIQIP